MNDGYVHVALPAEIHIQSIVTMHIQEHRKPYRFPGEAHNFWELECVTKGEARFTTAHGVFTLYEGDVIFHEPNEFHAVETCGDSICDLFVITFDALGHGLSRLRNRVFHLDNSQYSALHELISLSQSIFTYRYVETYVLAMNELTPPGFTELQIFRNHLELFLLQLLPSSTNGLQEEASRDVLSLTGNTILTQAISILTDHRFSNISITGLCEELNVSSGYLSSLFKKHTGKTVIEYYNSIKINEAIRMLTIDGANITETAGALGFSSIHYFSRLFKQYVGISPLNYIKINTGQKI